MIECEIVKKGIMQASTIQKWAKYLINHDEGIHRPNYAEVFAEEKGNDTERSYYYFAKNLFKKDNPDLIKRKEELGKLVDKDEAVKINYVYTRDKKVRHFYQSAIRFKSYLSNHPEGIHYPTFHADADEVSSQYYNFIKKYVKEDKNIELWVEVLKVVHPKAVHNKVDSIIWTGPVKDQVRFQYQGMKYALWMKENGGIKAPI
jgi:hypothetical protein